MQYLFTDWLSTHGMKVSEYTMIDASRARSQQAGDTLHRRKVVNAAKASLPICSCGDKIADETEGSVTI